MHRNETGRSAGRPAREDSGQQQQAILEAAEELFARQGYAATPLREIADRAGVNPALIHYYWGSKSGLLRAVMDDTLEPLATAMADLDPAEAGVETFTATLYGLLATHPALPALIMREVFLGEGEIRELFISEYAPRIGGALGPPLRAKQEEGLVRNDLSPERLALLIISLCLFPTLARPVAEPVLGIDYSPAGLDAMLAHVNELLKSGIES